VRHTQPGISSRFRDQWGVWEPCRLKQTLAQPASWKAIGAGAGHGDSNLGQISRPTPAQGPLQSGGGSGGEGCIAAVRDALYLRLPLRLQDSPQGSALAAAAVSSGLLKRGQSHRALTLDIQDVRRQVCLLI